MALRCLLFSSDEGALEPIRQVLASLDVEGESCSEGPAAVERVTSQSFQIVIIDWDMQPEAGFLLKSARERKASERPLTLAIVSDDASVPKALQAGANSILRKPIMVNQVNDTLTTARDLLRAKQESATSAAHAAAAGASGGTTTVLPSSTENGSEKTLRAGEFLQSSGPAPGAQFDTESEMQKSLEQSAVEEMQPLQELEPMAAAVAEAKPVSAPPPPPPLAPGETRGLQWYLNSRAGSLPSAPAQAPPPPPAPAPAKPELLGFDQTPSLSDAEPSAPEDPSAGKVRPLPAHPTPAEHEEHERKAEAKLFAYIAGEEEKPERAPRRTIKIGKGIMGALVLAACAIVAAPQAPWHPQFQTLWGRGRQVLHAWLNPQPVTTAPAPAAHENFGRAGDEYKLPVAENIPDATTDPTQIHVVPMVDPTAKKPNPGTAEQTPGQADGTSANPVDPTQPSGTQAPENQPAPETAQPAGTTAPSPAPTSTAPAEQPHPDPFVPAPPAPPVATQTAPAHVVQNQPVQSQPAQNQPAQPQPVQTQAAPRNPQPHNVSTASNTAIPSSLRSQMASMTPDASGNKPPEAALPSIEPVDVPEAAERALLADQPAVEYPATAKGQQGTVVLQVLIGRDGTVQDAKFLQGSLAFARNAIDGVKQWKFKPYLMNGRPASVQTKLTLSFKPTS